MIEDQHTPIEEHRKQISRGVRCGDLLLLVGNWVDAIKVSVIILFIHIHHLQNYIQTDQLFLFLYICYRFNKCLSNGMGVWGLGIILADFTSPLRHIGF